MNRKTFFQFTAPSNALMLLLMVFPLVMAIWLGLNFVKFSNINDPQYVGLDNYISTLSDNRFWESVQFTLIYIAVTVPLQIMIGFALALLLDQANRLIRGVYLSAMLLPFIVVPVVGTLMFKQLFEPSGLVSWFYRVVLEERFIFTASTVKAIIVVHSIWYVTPFALVTLFSGLQTLPQDLTEASSIDGASRWQQIRHIVIPHLGSLFLLIALISVMDAYRVFDSIFVLTERNPIFKAESVMLYNFEVAMSMGRLGKANAMAILTIIGVMVVLIPFLYRSYKEQVEER